MIVGFMKAKSKKTNCMGKVSIIGIMVIVMKATGSKVRNMEMVYLRGRMVASISENTRITKRTDLEYKLGQVAPDMKDNIKTTKRMGQELLLGPVALDMRDNGRIISRKELERRHGESKHNGVEILTTDSLKPTQCMVLEHVYSEMEMYTKGNGRLTKRMEQELSLGQQVPPMRGNGVMINKKGSERRFGEAKQIGVEMATTDNSKITECMVLERVDSEMVIDMRVNGMLTKRMAQELLLGKVAAGMRDNGGMINRKGLERRHDGMEISTTDNTKITICMALAHIDMQMEIYMKGPGRIT